MSRTNYVTGLRAVEELLELPQSPLRRLYTEYRSGNPRVRAIVHSAEQRGVEIQFANRARLRQISGEPRHQGVVAEVERKSLLDEAGLRDQVEQRLGGTDGTVLLLLLDGVQDPRNLGACLRSADAAGVDAVVVPRRGAAGLSPAASKVAAGAAESLPLAVVANLPRVLDWLRDYGVRRVGAAGDAEHSLYATDLTGPVALVMGGEHQGLSRPVAARCDQLVSLPMRGRVASLNVSVATGIALYEIRRQWDEGRS